MPGQQGLLWGTLGIREEAVAWYGDWKFGIEQKPGARLPVKGSKELWGTCELFPGIWIKHLII